MFEGLRRRMNTIARAAPMETGTGASSEVEAQKRMPMKEWLAKMKAGETPDTPPEPPKGNKEKKDYGDFVREIAISTGVGEYKPRFATEFEIALSTYAKGRLRNGKAASTLAAMSELNGQDNEGFKRVAAKIDEKLVRLGLVAPEPVSQVDTPPAEPAVAEVVEQAPVVAAESAPEAPAMPIVETVPVPPDTAPKPASSMFARPTVPYPSPERRIPKKETGGVTDEDIIGEQRAQGFAHPGAATGTIEEDAVRAAKSKRTVEKKAKKKAKSSAKNEKIESKKTESPAELEARVTALAADFDRQARADLERAGDLYAVARDALPESEHELFRQKVRALDWDINGEVEPSGSVEYVELLPSNNSVDELKKQLGRYTDVVNGIPYWILPDGDAAVLGKRSGYTQRVGDNGTVKVKGAWFKFAGGTFGAVSEEESVRLDEIERQREVEMTKTGRKPVETKADGGGVSKPEIKVTTPERPKRTLREAMPIFTRIRHREGMTLEKAFVEASKGLSVRDRRLLSDDIVKSGENAGMMESILRHIREQEAKQAHTKGERAPVRENLATEIDQEATRLFDKREPAPESRRTGETTAEKRRQALYASIEQEADEIFGKD